MSTSTMSSVLTLVGQPTKFFHDAIACFAKVILPLTFNFLEVCRVISFHFSSFYEVDAVASGCFEIAGKVVAHSILHDGPGFVGLAPCLREHLATGCVDTTKELVSLDDLPDLDLKHILEAKISSIYFFTGTVEAHLTATLFLLPPTLLLRPYSLYDRR